MFARKYKKELFLIWLAAFCSPATGSFAEEQGRHTWEVGPEISHIAYEEPGIMKEKGTMAGVAGVYTYHNMVMIQGEGRMSSGRVDYSSSSTGAIDDIKDFIMELRGLGGYDIQVSGRSIITPYMGLGYRYLNDNSAGRTSSTGHRGYERESNYLYSPVGLAYITELNGGWFIGASGEYDIFWYGKQISHLSDAVSGMNDVENRQHSGYGLRGAVKVRKKLSRISLSAEPFVRYWNIAKSDEEDIIQNGSKVAKGWEPENNSTECGLRFMIGF